MEMAMTKPIRKPTKGKVTERTWPKGGSTTTGISVTSTKAGRSANTGRYVIEPLVEGDQSGNKASKYVLEVTDLAQLKKVYG